MARKLTNFEQMWNAYPNSGEGSEAAKKTIGGNVNADWITNTCVIRVSRSFNYADHKIPKDFEGLNTISGGDGLRYGFRVEKFRKYLTKVYRPPQLSHKYTEPGGEAPEHFKRRQRVICFVVKGWRDATGYFDLWNGEDCIHSPYFHKASELYLWEVSNSGIESVRSRTPAPPRYSISAPVGEGGKNDAQDVKTVQKLLLENGADLKKIDGICTPETTEAIRTFQMRFLYRPDGRVDLNGRTWRELNKIY